MNATLKMESPRDVRSLLKWMQMGIVPSQAAAQAAKDYVEAMKGESLWSSLDLSGALKTLGYSALGVSPSPERCASSIAQMDQAILIDEELDSTSLRDRALNGMR